MLVRLIAIGAVISTASSLSPPDAHAQAQSPAQSEPFLTITIPSACADVWPQVFTGFDRSWNVTVLEPSQKEQELPMSDVLDHFVASVPGLASAVAPLDRLDRDLMYVRLYIRRLAELARQYPAIDRALLERAKVEACKKIVADPARTQAQTTGSTPEQRLAVAWTLLSEVERSPSANVAELRAKLHQARGDVQAVLDRDPGDSEGRKLAARIDALLAQLTPRAVPDDPTAAEAHLALERLEGLVKGGGRRGEVEARLRQGPLPEIRCPEVGARPRGPAESGFVEFGPPPQ
jgi:hypothetical protein